MATGKDLNSGVPTGRDRRDMPSSARFIELVDYRRQHSLRYNHGVMIRLQNWYNAYRGYWQGRVSQFRNNVTIPFTFAMIQSDVARKVQTTFGTWPIVSFEGYAPEDVARAKKNEVLVSAQLKDADSIVQAIDFMLQADICGTAIARYGWKHQVRKSKFMRRETVMPGMTIPVQYEKDLTIFDGPTWNTVDRLDFWQQPGKKRIDDMDWVIHRYWLGLDEMMEDANSEDPYFDPKAVKLLRDFPLQGFAHGEYVARRVVFRNEYDYMARQSEKFAKPVEIWEMHGLVPDEFCPDGIRHRCIAIGNGRVVLKNRPSSQPNVKPFKSYSPMPDPYSFDGVGKAEVAYGPQQTVNRIANQKLDALDLLIDPMYVVSSTANINTQHLFTRAGRMILVDGAADDSNIRALQPNMQGVSLAYNEIGQLWQFMQLGAGINDIIMGLQSGDRETARGFLGRQENVMTRLAFESRILEEQFVEPLANGFRDLDRMLLTTPHEVRILGSLASVDPVTGLPLPPERVTIDEEDLAPDYRARAVGASQALGKSVRQQNVLQLVQIMSSNPAMMQLVNWANFARQTFQMFDMKNVDELLVNQVPAVNQLAEQAGVSPGAVANAASSSNLPQLSPELLALLGNNQQQSPVGGLAGSMSPTGAAA
jgi:hypothetical protein